MRLVLDVDDDVLGQPSHAAEEQLRVALDQGRAPGEVGVEALDPAVVERQDVVLARLLHEQRPELVELVGHLRCEVVRLAPVGVGVVELPGVVGERRQRQPLDPRRGVPRDGGPALVVDAAVAEHLEVLRHVAFRRVAVVEGVAHAHALVGLLVDAVDRLGLREPRGLEDGGRDVDDVMELVAQLAARLDARGPVHDRAVARPAPVRGDLLGPLVRRVHRVRPADRVVVVGLRRPELVDPLGHELGRLQRAGAVERDQLVEAAVHATLGARPVVADDVVDERVLEDAEVLERVEQPPDVMVGVLHEAGVDLHLPGEHRLEIVGDLIPGRDLLGPRRQLGLGRDHAELLLAGERLLAQRGPSPDRRRPCTSPTTPEPRGAGHGWPRARSR